MKHYAIDTTERKQTGQKPWIIQANGMEDAVKKFRKMSKAAEITAVYPVVFDPSTSEYKRVQ